MPLLRALLVTAAHQVEHSRGAPEVSVHLAVDAARALGLAATPTTFAIADRRAASEVLNLPEDIQPFCVIPVGYPMGNFGPVTRKPVAEVMRWDRWS